MSFSRVRKYAGVRCPGHDYRSRCIYHIVLNKADNIPPFSEVIGIVDNHDWPPTVRLHATGNIIASCLSKNKKTFPFTSILRKCIMPDHVHIALFIKEETETHLGQIIAAFKRGCSNELEKLGYEPQTDLFIENYHDTFLRGKGQLKTLLKYISDNPRRHIVRKMNPGWFRKFSITRGDISYDAYGNWDLVYEPYRMTVKFSKKYSEEEIRKNKHSWHQAIINDGVLVSPFIHPEEKKARDWAMNNGGAMIYITYKPFPDKYKPQGKLFNTCAEGRLMIVSMPLTPKEQEYLDRTGKPSYHTCTRMNALALEIATEDFFVIPS